MTGFSWAAIDILSCLSHVGDTTCDTFLAMHIAIFSCYAYTKSIASEETKMSLSSLVRYWCATGFLEINRFLRTGELSERNKGDEAYFREDANTLIDAANQNFSAVIYRGISGNCDSVYRDKGISSWTTDLEVARRFADARSAQTGQVATIIAMQTERGFYLQDFIEGMGGESEQYEVLIAPGTYEVYEVDVH